MLCTHRHTNKRKLLEVIDKDQYVHGCSEFPPEVLNIKTLRCWHENKCLAEGGVTLSEMSALRFLGEGVSVPL